MSEIFLKIVNMSISASYIVLAVLLLRFLLKRAPRWITVALWGIVAIRLICPFSLESVLSLIPSAETVSPDIMLDRTPEINTGIPFVNDMVNPIIGTSFAPDPATSANPLQLWIPTFALFWILGMVALAVYTVISYARIRRKVRTAVLLRDNIYQSENVASPFVLGIVKPKIYLPFNMNDADMKHVVAHEQAHIRRRDHLWKPIGFLILTVHWFNPLVWLGYVLLCRDIELACDERVIKQLDRDERADYSQALLACSVSRKMISACPLAFGEVGVKDRIKSVLSYKKPAFWLIIAAVAACIAVAVCFLTDPPSNGNDGAMVNTEYEGVYISIESVDTDDLGNYVLNVAWRNDTRKEVTYGTPYSIQYKDGDEWVSVSTDEMVFTTQGFLLAPDGTARRRYSSAPFDISRKGSYRLLVSFSVKEGGKYVSYKTWATFSVGETLDVDSLRAKFPRYFGISPENGLDVYVWQMAKNSYSFGLLPHSEEERQMFDPELMNLKGASADEMRAILSSYNISEKRIHVIPWQNPLSSYIGEWWLIKEGEDADEKMREYAAFARGMLFGVVVNGNGK